MYKYLVVQSRWIRDSCQSGERVVAESNRRREAYGLARHNFNSYLHVALQHQMYDVEDFELIEEELSLTLADAEGIWLHTRFYVLETNEKS